MRSAAALALIKVGTPYTRLRGVILVHLEQNYVKVGTPYTWSAGGSGFVSLATSGMRPGWTVVKKLVHWYT